ncbi:hypothetical protein L195_g026344 [Trifolium pratense]|uniref:Uncharacterized protein n=1 Tax=Trifolium pratense TaxID=57577 RepID=A0A2K3NJ20_TRIPR|nr:hypothetical protein L195_g026344 [Trifolium pratense]
MIWSTPERETNEGMICHIEYLQSHSADVSRMHQIEAKLVALQVSSSASNGGSNSSVQSSTNKPFIK